MKPGGCIILGLLSFLCFNACNKQAEDHIDLKLPPATEEGKNTFGCIINDVVYTPYLGKCGVGSMGNITDTPPEGPVLSWEIINDDSLMRIVVSSYLYYCDSQESINKTFGFSFEIFKDREISYSLDYSSHDKPRCFFNASYIDKRQNCTILFQPNNASGKLIISHLDTINRIVAGTFNIQTLPSAAPNTCNTFTIKDGRFDIHY